MYVCIFFCLPKCEFIKGMGEKFISTLVKGKIRGKGGKKEKFHCNGGKKYYFRKREGIKIFFEKIYIPLL